MGNLQRALRLAIVPCLSASILLSIAQGTVAFATIYSYTDDAGVQNFTNQLDSIPGKYRSRVAASDVDLAPLSSTPVPVAPAVSISGSKTEQPAPFTKSKKVTARGEYRLGDHDTRTDGRRLAVEAAKKDALEQVATYLESVTEVRAMDVTRDDLRSYTAGIVKVLDEQITTRLQNNSIVIRADLIAEVDPHQVAQAIAALRENESAQHELVALRAETDRLQEQVDATNRALAAAPSPEEVQELSRQRDDMLNELQANALISQAWTSWTYPTVGYAFPWIAGPGINGLLFQAQRLSPRHRRLPLARQSITAPTQTPPVPLSQSGGLPAVQSLLVPSAPHPQAHQASPLLNLQGQPAKVGDVVVIPTPRSAPPAVRPSVPASPPSYPLHPSHFWRPSSPNIPTAPSVPGSASAPRSSAGSGRSGVGGYSGGGHSGGGHSGGGHGGR